MDFDDLGSLQSPSLAATMIDSTRDSLPIDSFSFFGCCLVVSAEEIEHVKKFCLGYYAVIWVNYRPVYKFAGTD